MASPRRISVKGKPAIYYREDANGHRRYEISFTNSEGRRQWRTVDGNLKDAEAARIEILDRLGKGARIVSNRRTLAEVAAEWIASQTELRPGTVARYKVALDVHILPRLGRKRVGEITSEHVAWLLADMKTGAYYTRDEDGELVRRVRKNAPAGATLQATIRPLSRILEDCDGVAGNPVRRLKKGQRPRAGTRAKRVLSADEVQRLLEHASALYRPLLAMAAYTGLRQSELLGLLWRDVDFDDGYVHVREQLDRDGRRVPPKTERAVRDVALAPRLAAMLKEHRLASASSAADDYVFVNEAGRPFNHRNVQARGFDRAAKRAKLDEGQARKATFHDLRRTYGSMLIAAGADIAHVSRQMGHANPSITLSIYTDEVNARANAERTRAMLDGAIGTSLETAGRDGWRNDAPAAIATVTQIGSASGTVALTATGGD